MPDGTAPSFLSHVYISIGGAALTTAEMNDLFRVEIDLTTYAPAMCLIELHDEKAEKVSDAKFDIGKVVEVKFKPQGGTTAVAVFKGEIVALQPEYDHNHINIQLVCFDKLHRLNRGSKTRTFLKAKDSEAVDAIAGEAGLGKTITATADIRDQIFQDNVNDLAFIQYLARRNGMILTCVDDKLILAKATTAGEVATLKFGVELLYFRPRLTSTQQVSKVTVKGWNVKDKAATTGTATASTTNPAVGYGKTGMAVVSSNFGAQELVEIHPDAVTSAAAKKLADGRLDDINSGLIPAEGRAFGTPTIVPNAKIKIEGVGARFSGTYVVTGAKHIYSHENGYETEFIVEGNFSETTSSLVQPISTESPRLWYGVTPAIVTNNNDPEKYGRVKLKFPYLDDAKESDWARVVSADAGPARGLLTIPEVADEVMVAFENGNFNHPYVLGGLWNGKDAPPEVPGKYLASGKIVQRMWKTRTHSITLLEGDSDSKIEILEKNGLKVMLDGQNKLIEVSDGGSNKVVIDIQGKKLTIESEGDIEMKAKNINMKASAAVKVEATGNVEIKGAAVKLN